MAEKHKKKHRRDLSGPQFGYGGVLPWLGYYYGSGPFPPHSADQCPDTAACPDHGGTSAAETGTAAPSGDTGGTAVGGGGAP